MRQGQYQILAIFCVENVFGFQILDDAFKETFMNYFLEEEPMKRIRIDLKKLDSSSKQPKEFSEALLGTKKSKEENRGFTKTFVASGKVVN